MIKKYIKELTELNGVSARENKIIEYMFDQFAKNVQEVRVDKVGNVIAKIKAEKENVPKIMIFGHMDEVGMIIRKIENNGFLRIERLGGVSTQILPGTIVNITGKENEVKGVIGTPSHHFIKPEEKFSVPQVKDLYVDIGAESAEDVKNKGIHVGDWITFENQFIELGENKICAKALDDRAALAIMLEVLKNIKDHELGWDVYFVAATMEEFNIRGILPAVREIRPDVMLGIDITPSCDTPEMDYNDIALGKGPALTYMNFHGRGTLAGVLPDEKILHYIESICDENEIKYQREVAPGVITENAFTLFENNGICVANISIPTRYTHTPIECIDIRDVEEIVKLLTKIIVGLKNEESFGKVRVKV